MEPTERLTFYDQHPFDWVAVDRDQDIGRFVSNPLVEMIEVSIQVPSWSISDAVPAACWVSWPSAEFVRSVWIAVASL